MPMTGRTDRPVTWPEALFVYGTLLFPDLVRALIGRVPDRTAAAVPGWRAAALPGRPYPGLVRAAGATARGLLLTGLTAAEWQIIDDFEDGGYDLTELALVDGRPAWAYTWAYTWAWTEGRAGAEDTAPLPEDWSADEFAEHHLAGYVAQCTLWRRQGRC